MVGKLEHIRTLALFFALVIALFISASAEARYATQAAVAASADDGAGDNHQAGAPNYDDLLREVEKLKAENTKKNAELKVLRERIEALEAARTQRDSVKPDSKDSDTAH